MHSLLATIRKLKIELAATSAPLDNLVSNGVNIGTTTPNEGKVEVKGGSVCVDTNSDGTASSCIASESDIRLKKDVVTIDNALDKILKLRGVAFNWKVNDTEVLSHYPLISRFASNPHSLGLIAQEVAPVLPEAIMQETVGDNTTHYLQLDYNRLIPLLIEGMKEQQKQIEQLKAKNAELENDHVYIQQLNERIKALEMRLGNLEGK